MLDDLHNQNQQQVEGLKHPRINKNSAYNSCWMGTIKPNTTSYLKELTNRWTKQELDISTGLWCGSTSQSLFPDNYKMTSWLQPLLTSKCNIIMQPCMPKVSQLLAIAGPSLCDSHTIFGLSQTFTLSRGYKQSLPLFVLEAIWKIKLANSSTVV